MSRTCLRFRSLFPLCQFIYATAPLPRCERGYNQIETVYVARDQILRRFIFFLLLIFTIICIDISRLQVSRRNGSHFRKKLLLMLSVDPFNFLLYLCRFAGWVNRRQHALLGQQESALPLDALGCEDHQLHPHSNSSRILQDAYRKHHPGQIQQRDGEAG